ncbi:MAG: M48 family metalloprotease [Thiobacillus sp.]
MIPSTPRRTWLFLIASSLAYFGPDLLVPAAWAHTHAYLVGSAFYQGLLVVLGFGFGPALCRAMAVGPTGTSALDAAIEQGRAGLKAAGLAVPPVTRFDHAMPFVLTAGLLPRQCAVFVSTGLATRLTPSALQFLLARAAVHATLRHRLAALLPLLVFTVLPPDGLKSPATWIETGGFLFLWLMVHWAFELDADRCAARAVGAGAGDALREGLAISHPHPAWFSTHPPVRWRLRAVRANA